MRGSHVGLCLLSLLTATCSRSQSPGEPQPSTGNPGTKLSTVEVAPQKLAAFGVLPQSFVTTDRPVTDARVELGRALFFDPRLSKNHDLSCNSCHDLAKYGVDIERFSTGHRGQKGGRNAPTVFNAAGHVAQFWDGREPDVEAQAKGPMMNPVEMAMPKADVVVAVLRSIPGYAPLFARAFPDESAPITLDNATRAIGAFERMLVTPARWDRFLANDTAALSDAEKRGLEVFADSGCATCHFGTLVGGAMFQKLGMVKAWPDAHDQGRYQVTKQDADRMVFKVPSLRNVAKTAPYFHDGSVATLPEAVRLMARHQLGKELVDADVARIVDFLGALTGEPPPGLIAQPDLLPSSPRTPIPDPG